MRNRQVDICAVAPKCGSAGHTLVELLIAAGLGLLVVAAAASLYRLQRQASVWSAQAAALHDAGMTAVGLLSQQIEMAGYVPADQPLLAELIEPAVFGCASGTPVGDEGRPGCDRDVDSEGIMVRYIDDAVATWPSGAGQATDCLGQTVGRAGEHAVVVNTFFVDQPARDSEPELYCRGSGGSSKQPVVAGVERIKLRYWLRGARAAVDAAAILPQRWSGVVAVELCVVVRTREAGHRKDYVGCDGAATRAPDARARQAFVRHVAVRNHEEWGV